MISSTFLTTALLLLSANAIEQTQKNQKARRSLILDGELVTSENKYPFFPAVYGRRETFNEFGNETIVNSWFCGGVLIAPDVVLTIGHCINKTNIVAMRCQFDMTNLLDTNSRVIEASSWIVHDTEREDHALGLIFLEQEITDIVPVNPMLDNTRPLQGDKLTLMGYGHTENSNSSLSRDLLEDEIEVTFTSVCDANFTDASVVNEKQFCAGGNGTGACVGDSGNPVIDDAGRVAGIVSYGNFPCTGSYPTVLTRVGAFTEFLKENVCNRTGIFFDDPEWCAFREPVPSFGGSEDEGGGFFACFAETNQIQVKNEEVIQNKDMKDLSIGDMVHVGDGIYEPVYSFGHYAPSMKSEMLQIETATTAPLRISPNHMVVTASKGTIPASQLQVGDELLTSYSSDVAQRVQKIDSVVARGMYAPFTPSGKIVVDGILASSYIAFEDNEGLEFGMMKISHQWMAHAGSFPHRFMCYYSNSCANEKYSAEGIADGIYGSLMFYKNIFETTNTYGSFVRSVVFGLVMIVLMTFTGAESIMMIQPSMIIGIILLLGAISTTTTATKKKKLC
eukprot:CAMPEP_0194159560 /NCGR_PEP_ID=MMETSP0152-20130528/77902_1 /TAXON_ID=1049557 /ORGANISM="Thalassiothrix antarctica, Strain L6-D1" /LENGTH=562 /DNA_ID=CAMNT_0038869145 /DNA_START=129 /DNA_END=1817 /DNA_ORIENTATION=-